MAVLKSKLKILHSYWERVYNGNAALAIMEGIESTDYYQKDDYIEAYNAYSVAVSSIQEQIEALEPPIPNQATGSGDGPRHLQGRVAAGGETVRRSQALSYTRNGEIKPQTKVRERPGQPRGISGSVCLDSRR